jgi:hypothetical protein
MRWAIVALLLVQGVGLCGPGGGVFIYGHSKSDDGGDPSAGKPKLTFEHSTSVHVLAIPPSVEVPEKTLAQAIEAEFVKTTSWLSLLRKRVGTANEERVKVLGSIQESSDFLHDRWRVWLKEHSKEGSKLVSSSKDAYWFSWYQDNNVLGTADKTDSLTKMENLIHEVAEDMKVKADNARHSADGLGKEVLVKVHTKRNAQEINGYQVWYVQKGMLDDKSFHTRFGKLSTPTEQRGFCPGRYAMWARKDKTAGEPSTIQIPSQLGARSDDVDVDAP